MKFCACAKVRLWRSTTFYLVSLEKNPDCEAIWFVLLTTLFFVRAGQVVERGTHKQLVALQGEYFNLVKKQMASEKPTLTLE